MTVTAWRLVKARHQKTAFDGDGARRYGGRWNARGTAMVYLGGSRALAALEILAHLGADDARLQFLLIGVDIPEKVRIEELDLAALPANWRAEPPPVACQMLGNDWANAGSSAVLRVPSVIIPRECNYLLNPDHADFDRLVFHPHESFGFDSRMWK